MPNLALLALEASDGTVVLTSITLVFAMLIALCLMITLEGSRRPLPHRLPKLPRHLLPSPLPPLLRLTMAASPARSLLRFLPLLLL